MAFTHNWKTTKKLNKIIGCSCNDTYIKYVWHTSYCMSSVFQPQSLLLRLFLLCFQMNMLLRLQEAANYSSTQSCDSDSTSHHDEQLDSSLESALWGPRAARGDAKPFECLGAFETPPLADTQMCDIWKVLLSKMVYPPFERKTHIFT